MTRDEPEEDFNERPARSRQRSRYDRPRSTIIWTVLLLGMLIGMAGGLYYAWIVAPVEETDVAPWQLETSVETDNLLAAEDAYIIAITMAYTQSGDLATTVQRLVELRLPGNDPFQYVADTACRLTRNGYVNSNSRRNAIRSMMVFYQRQGKSGCADQLIVMDSSSDLLAPTVVVLPTPTLVPPASKTPPPAGTLIPSPTPDPDSTVPATRGPSGSFDFIVADTFCSTDFPGVIEIWVRDRNGQDIPGMPLRVRGDDEVSDFFTGLKQPERSAGYADFQMEPVGPVGSAGGGGMRR
jgi:hypothetical protein